MSLALQMVNFLTGNPCRQKLVYCLVTGDLEKINQGIIQKAAEYHPRNWGSALSYPIQHPVQASIKKNKEGGGIRVNR